MLGITVGLLGASIVSVSASLPEWVQVLAIAAAVLWCVPVSFLAVRWAWRKLTYRVGVNY